MAASVAVVNGHPDQGHKLKSGLKSLHHGKKRLADPVDLRPFSAVIGSDLDLDAGEDRRKQADESIRQVMYLTCWARS
ncbi:hypothetical protein Vadar_020257 [Vaccinium darrowii]|uniref:Uncharacterized protein n=1 Tax=Vaccinium darrowii TaxID=229202 RepID=A0ACB7XSN1_9ERIC|nr:hypothetical protein Vadar_020257 [Vaccinium darrowii]